MFRSECNGCLSMWRILTNKVNIMMGIYLSYCHLEQLSFCGENCKKGVLAKNLFFVYKQLST